jgi:hypothetical protein
LLQTRASGYHSTSAAAAPTSPRSPTATPPAAAADFGAGGAAVAAGAVDDDDVVELVLDLLLVVVGAALVVSTAGALVVATAPPPTPVDAEAVPLVPGSGKPLVAHSCSPMSCVSAGRQAFGTGWWRRGRDGLWMSAGVQADLPPAKHSATMLLVLSVHWHLMSAMSQPDRALPCTMQSTWRRGSVCPRSGGARGATYGARREADEGQHRDVGVLGGGAARQPGEEDEGDLHCVFWSLRSVRPDGEGW